MKLEQFSPKKLEPCAGLGYIADTLRQGGYMVRESDLLTRGRDIVQADVFSLDSPITADIVTNPPYSCAAKIIRHLLSLMQPGTKLAMWLRILFLESAERKRLFDEFPPIGVWCGKNGEFGASAQGYGWYVWEKGHEGTTSLGWF